LSNGKLATWVLKSFDQVTKVAKIAKIAKTFDQVKKTTFDQLKFDLTTISQYYAV
jgi:hypothetical protein